MTDVKIIDVLSDLNEQLDKITLSEFLSVMALVGKKIKSERSKLKESKTLSEKEIDKLVSLYENIKNYLFDIFSSNDEKLSSVEKMTLLHEQIKKYLAINDDAIRDISPEEIDTINKQCPNIKFEDIGEKISDIKARSDSVSIDEFDGIYECMENTLNLFKQAVNKIQHTKSGDLTSTDSKFVNKKLIRKEEEIIELLKELNKKYQIFKGRNDLVEEIVGLATSADASIELENKVSSMVKIGKIYEQITIHKKQVEKDVEKTSSLIAEILDYIEKIEKIEKKTLTDLDDIYIKETKEKMLKYTSELEKLNTDIDTYREDIEKNKIKAYDNLAGTGIIKYDNYNDYKNIAGSDQDKMVTNLSDESIREILNNNIRLIGNETLEELYYIIDQVKNYLFAHQHFINKGMIGVQWNFSRDDLNKYIENPKKGVNNSTWPTGDSNVPPLPNSVQMIALYLKVLINISDYIFKELGQKLKDDDNLRITLKTMFVDNESHKNQIINKYKYDGKEYKDAIKKDSGCNFYIEQDRTKIKPESEYLLTGGKSNIVYLRKYIKYKTKYIKIQKIKKINTCLVNN